MESKEEINTEKTEEKKPKEKKKKHIVLKTFIFVVLLGLAICFYSKYYEVKHIKVKEYKIQSRELPLSFDGIKIVHFSDILYGSAIKERELENLVSKINELKPDIVVFTGNLIYKDYNYTKEDMDYIVSTLSKIESTVGKYAVKGMHDNRIEDYQIYLSNAGFMFLDNSYDLVYYKGFVPIYITGLSSYLTTKIDLNKAFLYYQKKDNEEKDDKESMYKPEFKIVLVNESDAVEEILSYDSNINMILTGGSLGGLIKIPFYGPLTLQDGSRKYSQEKYTLVDTEVYVSSGVGTPEGAGRLFNYPSFNFYRLYTID